MSSLTNALSGAWHCFFASMYGNLFQMDTRAQGEGGTSMFGSLGMYRFVWYRFMGSSILKKLSNSLFSVLNRVRIEGLKQHSPKQNFFKSLPPPPPPPPEKFLPIYMTTTRQKRLRRFFLSYSAAFKHSIFTVLLKETTTNGGGWFWDVAVLRREWGTECKTIHQEKGQQCLNFQRKKKRQQKIIIRSSVEHTWLYRNFLKTSKIQTIIFKELS